MSYHIIPFIVTESLKFTANKVQMCIHIFVIYCRLIDLKRLSLILFNNQTILLWKYLKKLKLIERRRKLLAETKKHIDAGKHLDLLGRAEHFFGLYNIDYNEETLKKEYKRKLHMFHPDKHHGVDEYELEDLRNFFDETQKMYQVIKRSYGI